MIQYVLALCHSRFCAARVIARSVEVDTAIAISKELGGLPLALDQAGAYIEETQCSLSDYQNLYRTHRAELLQERGGSIAYHPESVVTTLSLAFAKVEQKYAVAADLLRFCAFLHPDTIPEEILIAGLHYFGTNLQGIANNPLFLNKAVALLGTYSLLRRNATEKAFNVHRLVQAILKDKMDILQKQQWIENSIQTLSSIFPTVDYQNWSQCERLLPHTVEVLGQFTPKGDREFLEQRVVPLYTKVGLYYLKRAQYSQAESQFQHCLKLCQDCFEPNHAEIARQLTNVADIYSELGKYEEADSFYTEALQMWLDREEYIHLNALPTISSIARLSYIKGQYKEAELFWRIAYQIMEERVDKSNSYYLEWSGIINNLANVCCKQEDYDAGESFYKGVLEIREKLLGGEHPDVASVLNNLGLLYAEQERYEEAEPIYTRALAIREKTLGPEHPKVAETLSNLVLQPHLGSQASCTLFDMCSFGPGQMSPAPV